MPRPSFAIVVAVGALGCGSSLLTAQFRSAVHVVQLNATVHSADNPVTDLTAGDFRVTDNGVAQRVLEVSRGTMPVDLTILFDTSVRSPGVRALDSALARVKKWLRPQDRMSLITFDAALRDAVADVLAAPPIEGRRQLAVVLTKSPDTSSVRSEDAVLSLARRSSVALFSVSPSRVNPHTNQVAANPIADRAASPLPFLEEVTAITGGVAHVLPDFQFTIYGPARVQAHANVDIFTGPLMKALDEFRTSYVLSYSPQPVEPGWHEVSVTATRGRATYTVRTRQSYFVE